MESFSAVVVGAGHAGLAASRVLAEQDIDHVVLERGEVANTWRWERWDSLRLLTPNWLLRLPGQRYNGSEPDGYATVPQLIRFLDQYAWASRAEIRTQTELRSLRRNGADYELLTSGGSIRARSVIVATGAGNVPRVPAFAAHAPAEVRSLSTHDYSDPDSLPPGGVLIVGAAATGVQLAEEIHRSGRRVVLAVGEHVRMPRTYRGRDILWWMDTTQLWNQRFDEIDDLQRVRGLPSPQLIGTGGRSTLDLNALTAQGIEIVGRLAAIREGTALFSGGLAHVAALADLKLERLLDTFDAWHVDSGRTHRVGPVQRFEPTKVPDRPRLSIDLRSGEITTILWATGFRPDYRWLDLPVLDRRGELVHQGGVVTGAPGLYAMGLPVLRRRKSTFIHGAEEDARDLVAHLKCFLGAAARRPAVAVPDPVHHGDRQRAAISAGL